MSTKAKERIPNKVRRRRERMEARQAARDNGEATAKARYVKVSPRKARLVIDAIRGKSTTEALNYLRFSEKKAARFIGKVVESAVANAENNFMFDADNLIIYKAYVDEGPVIKRFRPRAMGRATPIRKRTSHITIVVKERGEGN